jgi:hypothetical protein
VDEEPAEYYFHIMDTEYYPVTSVSAVYGDGELIPSGSWSVNLNTGIITMAAGVAEDFADSVTCDFIGAPIYNAVAIIKDIMAKYANIEFIPTNYDTTETNRTQSRTANVSIYLADEGKVIDAVELCCKDTDIGFIVLNDGRFSARRYESDRTPRRTIETDEWTAPPTISIDESKILSGVTVLYKPRREAGEWSRHHNDDYEVEVNRRYKNLNGREVETNLTTLADAAARSESIMALSKEIFEQVNRKTVFRHVDLEIMDFIVSSPVTRPGSVERPAIYEIVGINKNLDTFDLSLTLQFVRFYTPPAPEVFNSGILWYEKLYGHKLHTVAYGGE